MPEKLIADATVKTTRATEKGVEGLVRKAWSVMDAASEKKAPSQYLSGQALRSIRGKE
jgi:hypothetical protein